MAYPVAQDVRDLLEGYQIDTTGNYSLTGNLSIGLAVITNVDTRLLRPTMLVQSAHLPANTKILTVDIVSATGQITCTQNATATITEALNITYYTFLSDSWIQNKMTRSIIPYLENVCNTTFAHTTQIEEYYSGNGSSILTLNRKPIISLDSVSYTNVIADQFVIQLNAIQVLSTEGILKVRTNFNESTWIPIFPRGLENMRIKYTYGYVDVPVDIFDAVCCLTAERALTLIGARTGGGSLSVKDFSRDFGDLGKYTDIRKELAKDAYMAISNYFTRSVGAG